VLDKPIK